MTTFAEDKHGMMLCAECGCGWSVDSPLNDVAIEVFEYCPFCGEQIEMFLQIAEGKDAESE